MNKNYDRFEQRTYLKLGNGVETNYTYRDDNRRLKNLSSSGTVAGTFQNLAYTYDPVGNITDLANKVAIPAANSFGGPTTQHFDYDDLYRLTHAGGNFKSSPSKVRDYTLDMVYSDIHNITGKTQVDNLTSAGGKPIPQKATSYDWAYAYAGTQPHAPTHIGSHTFSYDADGNQLGWSDDKNGTRRIMLWDEDNRIAEIDDNGERSKYTYDDKGERVIKTGRQGETVYVNQYYVVRNRSIVSKHLYAGSSRLVTELVMGTAPGNGYQGAGSNPSTGSGQVPGGQGTGQAHDNQGLHLGQEKQNPGQGDEHRNTDNSQAAEHGKSGKGANAHDTGDSGAEGATNLPGKSDAGLENALANGKGNKYGIYKRLDKLGDTVDASGEIVVDADAVTGTGSVTPPPANGQSEFTYYYHPDHLGSTGYVTDASGKLYEHLEYFPFGETWVQEHSNTLRTPYLFTGKEFDQETGLYYFGARYYDPRTSVWQSADRILGTYLHGEHNGGIYTPVHLALYSYVTNNPLVHTDPDGNAELYSTSGQFLGSFAPKINKVFVEPQSGTALTDTHMTMGQFHHNEQRLGRVLMSEASIGNEAEQRGVGHTVLNRMARNHTNNVSNVERAYGRNQAPNNHMLALARKLLVGGDQDNTGKATHYYSPRSMPLEGQSTEHMDVRGGLEQTPGMSRKNYSPGWSKTYNRDAVSGARDKFYKFYSAPGTDPVH